MALLWTDGFDLYGSASATMITAMEARGYTFPSCSLDDDTGRLSGNSLEINYTYDPIDGPVLNTTNATLICGFGWKYEARHATNNAPIFRFFSGADEVSLVSSTTGELMLFTGSTLVDTSVNTLSVDTWYHIEWKITCGANSPYTVKVGGDVWLSGNGDTQDGSATYYNRFSLFPTAIYLGSSYSQWFDDLYIMDATGNTNNDLVGDCKVVTIKPDGDDSCNFATLSTGNDHYALVDDAPFDGDSTYVEDSTTGNRDVFTYEDATDVDTVLGISIITASKKTDTDPISIKSIVDSNGTIEAGSNFALGTDYLADNTISEEDPDTSSAWTLNTVNAAKFGFEVV